MDAREFLAVLKKELDIYTNITPDSYLDDKKSTSSTTDTTDPIKEELEYLKSTKKKKYEEIAGCSRGSFIKTYQ